MGVSMCPKLGVKLIKHAKIDNFLSRRISWSVSAASLRSRSRNAQSTTTVFTLLEIVCSVGPSVRLRSEVEKRDNRCRINLENFQRFKNRKGIYFWKVVGAKLKGNRLRLSSKVFVGKLPPERRAEIMFILLSRLLRKWWMYFFGAVLRIFFRETDEFE